MHLFFADNTEIKSAAGDRGRETKAESGAQKGEGGTRVQLQRKGKREEGPGGGHGASFEGREGKETHDKEAATQRWLLRL